jgi:hypothetical protein
VQRRALTWPPGAPTAAPGRGSCGGRAAGRGRPALAPSPRPRRPGFRTPRRPGPARPPPARSLTASLQLCSHGTNSVSGLHVVATNLTGPLPDVFGQLPDLQLLEIAFNRGARQPGARGFARLCAALRALRGFAHGGGDEGAAGAGGDRARGPRAW